MNGVDYQCTSAEGAACTACGFAVIGLKLESRFVSAPDSDLFAGPRLLPSVPSRHACATGWLLADGSVLLEVCVH
jgi:hypothetical protein